MIFLDTNYLVRFFVNDIKDQALAAKKIIKEPKEIYISTIVMAEVVFILTNYYKIDKSRICNELLSLIKQPNIKTQNFISFALQIYSNENFSFYDSLLLSEAIEKNAQLKTFDKKLSKLYSKYPN